jgi:hypothetical protein
MRIVKILRVAVSKSLEMKTEQRELLVRVSLSDWRQPARL